MVPELLSTPPGHAAVAADAVSPVELMVLVLVSVAPAPIVTVVAVIGPELVSVPPAVPLVALPAERARVVPTFKLPVLVSVAPEPAVTVVEAVMAPALINMPPIVPLLALPDESVMLVPAFMMPVLLLVSWQPAASATVVVTVKVFPVLVSVEGLVSVIPVPVIVVVLPLTTAAAFLATVNFPVSAIFVPRLRVLLFMVMVPALMPDMALSVVVPLSIVSAPVRFTASPNEGELPVISMLVADIAPPVTEVMALTLVTVIAVAATAAFMLNVLPALALMARQLIAAFKFNVPFILMEAPLEVAVRGAPRFTVPAVMVTPPPGKLIADAVLLMVVVPLTKFKAAGFDVPVTLNWAPRLMVLPVTAKVVTVRTAVVVMILPMLIVAAPVESVAFKFSVPVSVKLPPVAEVGVPRVTIAELLIAIPPWVKFTVPVAPLILQVPVLNVRAEFELLVSVRVVAPSEMLLLLMVIIPLTVNAELSVRVAGVAPPMVSVVMVTVAPLFRVGWLPDEKPTNPIRAISLAALPGAVLAVTAPIFQFPGVDQSVDKAPVQS